MWMNLDTLPAGKSMFTVYVTLDDEGTPRSETSADEVDVVAPRNANWSSVVNEGTVHPSGEAAKDFILELYGPDSRVVGVVNVSEDYVVFDAWHDSAEFDGLAE